MPAVTAPTTQEAVAKLDAEISAKCKVAFDCGCRLAAIVVGMTELHGETMIMYQFKVISPGEGAEEGWTLYEDRQGMAVGRSA